MKRITGIILLMTFCAGAFAQSGTLSKKEQRKLLREEKRREASKELEESSRLVELMVSHATFVLEADMIFDRYGQSSTVQSSINFLLADSLYGVIQVGNSFQMGQNGLGGFTIEGRIINYTYKKNEKKSTFSVNYSIKSTIGTYDITLNAGPSGRADATISGSFSSGSLRFSGQLVHPARSKVYKGSAL